MSTSGEIASHEGPGEAAPDSVFDFLYHDSRRIGSFLSQFDPNGLLTGINQGETAARGKARGWKVGVGADVPMLAGGKVEFERGPIEAGSESLERSYDPFWVNALALLDFLEEKSLIHRSIEEANLGQFVLVSGRLSVLDLTLMRKAWDLKSIQQTIRAAQDTTPTGNRQQRRSQGQSNQKSAPTEVDLILELMTILPHSVHATVMTEEETVWANLREEYLVTPSSDLVLTYGAHMPGNWSMLGILNAQPDIGSIEHQQAMAEIGGHLPPGLVSSAIGQAVQVLAPIIRTVLGRPTSSYAVTPLLVFRSVS